MAQMTTTIDDGFSVSAGQTPDGWFAAVLTRPDRDRDFVEHLSERNPDDGAPLKPGATDEQWCKALRGSVGLGVELITPEGRTVLSTVERVWGPAAANRSRAPLVGWTEQRESEWRFMVRGDGGTNVAFASPSILRAPAIAELDGKTLVACQMMGAAGPAITLRNGDGQERFSASGRNPKLAAGTNRAYLLWESPQADGSCRLRLVTIDPAGVCAELAVPAGDDMNLNAALHVATESDDLLVVHEGCPAWGHDHFVGRHRDLYLWRLRAGADQFDAPDGAAPGRLPLAYRASHNLNRPPLQPRALMVDGQPAVAFRRFEYYTSRPFAWHVYLTRYDGRRWSDPARLTAAHGFIETDYGLLPGQDGSLLTFLTYGDQVPVNTREDYLAGRFPWPNSTPHRIDATRVEIRQLPADTDNGPVLCLPNHVEGQYIISLRTRDVAPAPSPDSLPPAALKQLVWGDLHQHSLWSKCMSMVDGTREENLRYQRDTLGCRIFSFGEHTSMMSDAEFTYYLDQLEAEAGADGVYLYGTEPWSAGHDTNFYAIDRDVFTRLRVLYLRHRALGDILAAVKREFPNREVAAIRHFHGGAKAELQKLFSEGDPRLRWGSDDPAVVNTWVPEIEPAMEAMQVRGNVLLGETQAHPGLPAFPTNFLNAGCRVGLVGGSDHSSDFGPNHFCLTGFWVPELSAAAVWEALWERRTVACSNGKIAIWAECHGAPMGQSVTVDGEVRIKTALAAARPVRRVTLVRDGEILGWQDVNATSAELDLVDQPAPGPHWYSVTAEGESAPDLQRPVLAHASPIFVAG